MNTNFIIFDINTNLIIFDINTNFIIFDINTNFTKFYYQNCQCAGCALCRCDWVDFSCLFIIFYRYKVLYQYFL